MTSFNNSLWIVHDFVLGNAERHMGRVGGDGGGVGSYLCLCDKNCGTW